jgi:HUS1 checkpoint protein
MQAIEKLQKKCIIKFTEKEMQIICNSDANEGGIQVWSAIKVDSIFTAYRIQSNAENEITVSLSSEALLAALQSAAPPSTYEAEEVVVKLAKKNDKAVLSFEISGQTVGGHKVRVTHDVRIEVLKPADVARLKEPMCPEPDIHIILPPLQKLRIIVDKLRPMSNILAFRANHNGQIQISISTESVKLDTRWENCSIPTMVSGGLSQEVAEDQAEKPGPDHLFTVLVSIRSFLKFLNSYVVSTTTIACVCQNHCMILYVYIGDAANAGGVLTFYIPAIID